MKMLNRSQVLIVLNKNKTLLFDHFFKIDHLGIFANADHLQHILNELTNEGSVIKLNGTVPATYTITTKGLDEINHEKNLI